MHFQNEEWRWSLSNIEWVFVQTLNMLVQMLEATCLHYQALCVHWKLWGQCVSNTCLFYQRSWLTLSLTASWFAHRLNCCNSDLGAIRGDSFTSSISFLACLLNVNAPWTLPLVSFFLILHPLHCLYCPHTQLHLPPVCVWLLPKSMSTAQTALLNIKLNILWMFLRWFTQNMHKNDFITGDSWDVQIVFILSGSHSDNSNRTLVSPGATYTLMFLLESQSFSLTLGYVTSTYHAKQWNMSKNGCWCYENPIKKLYRESDNFDSFKNAAELDMTWLAINPGILALTMME